jgi:predicted nucleic acid-binding protein
MRPGEASATREYLENLICIEVTREIAQTAGTLKYIWARKGLTLDIPDAIVAATTLTFNLHLATDNRKHFPMPEIIHIQIPTS